jgi:hypothetical protein
VASKVRRPLREEPIEAIPQPAPELKEFLATQDKSTLIAVLAELAEANEPVRQRLERLKLRTDPRKLATAFKRILSAWRRSTKFIDLRAGSAFAAELLEWLDQVERELVMLDPARALDLIEALIECDGPFMERADDSDGSIGDVLRIACERWLQTAKQINNSDIDWVERIYSLANADDYGVREALLSQANMLLDEASLRVLAGRFEGDLYLALKQGSGQSLAPQVFMASGSIHLVSEALGDPDLHVRAVTQYSPNPNDLQKAGFAEAYLQHQRPEKALAWLEGNWGNREDSRLRLLAQTQAMLGHHDDAADIRRRVFCSSGAVDDFRAWRELLSSADHEMANQAARDKASAVSDPIDAARLLLEIGDAAGAANLLVERYEAIDGRRYYLLLPVAEALEASQLLLGCTACYRALLLGILSRGYAPAYAHAARYFKLLRRFTENVSDFGPLSDHEEFEIQLSKVHGRKTSFWNHIARN